MTTMVKRENKRIVKEEQDSIEMILMQAKKIKIQEYEVYMPLFEGLLPSNRINMFYSIILILRRIIFTLSVMFLKDFAWV